MLITPSLRSKQYISPSDNIMSPCTAKLNAFRNKQVGKYVLPAFINLRLYHISQFSIILSRAWMNLDANRTIVKNRVKPKSLFAQASAKKLEGEALFGAKPKSFPTVD